MGKKKIVIQKINKEKDRNVCPIPLSPFNPERSPTFHDNRLPTTKEGRVS